MAIMTTSGDLLKQHDVDAIVNTVNCVGVIGKGIALQFKKKWPQNFKAYAAACKAGPPARIATTRQVTLHRISSAPVWSSATPLRRKTAIKLVDYARMSLITRPSWRSFTGCPAASGTCMSGSIPRHS